MDAQPVRRRSLVLVFVSDHAGRGAGCNAGVGRVSTTRGGSSFHPGWRELFHVIELRAARWLDGHRPTLQAVHARAPLAMARHLFGSGRSPFLPSRLYGFLVPSG